MCDRLYAITGGGTTPSLLSAWETGRERTGKRNRRALSQLFGIDAVTLFAHQDRDEAATAPDASGSGGVIQLITRYDDLLHAMTQVITGGRGSPRWW
ncbi:hypothetical protein ACSLP5_30070 [Streptomyces albus]